MPCLQLLIAQSGSFAQVSCASAQKTVLKHRTFEEDGGLHVHKGQRNKLSETHCLRLQLPKRNHVACPRSRRITVPKLPPVLHVLVKGSSTRCLNVYSLYQPLSRINWIALTSFTIWVMLACKWLTIIVEEDLRPTACAAPTTYKFSSDSILFLGSLCYSLPGKACLLITQRMQS